MKEYNIKLLINNEQATFIFDCDKEKNNQCNKRNCNEYCNHTTDGRYMKAKERQHDKNITDKEIIINLEKEIEYYRNKIQYMREDMILTMKPKDIISYEEAVLYAGDKQVRTIIDYKYE